MRQRSGLVRRGAAALAGLTVGALLAPFELLLVAFGALTLVAVRATPRARTRAERFVHRCARQLSAVEVWRLDRFHRIRDLGPYDDRAAYTYLLRRWPIGGLGALVVLLLLYGLVVAGTMVSAWLFDGSWGYIESADRVSTATIAVAAIPGALLLYINVMGLAGVVDLDAKLARRHLTPSVEEALTRRISELTVSRAEVVEVVNEERRRIERDLHDGLQQRLVALGLLLSRARRSRDPSVAGDLIRQAHEESELALADLRDVAWRVYPTALDQLGLQEVLAALTERSSIPVRLHYDLPARPPAGVETAAYFVISEALTNAVKHSRAKQIEVTLTPTTTTGAGDRPERSALGPAAGVRVTVTDDGKGGADVTGRGLTGLAGRVVANDGRLTISSPSGGPTTIQAEFPCE
ncbi:sensor histidine kinase [Kribbella shirazensis]|uniref:histidine kinase n=1 Tax=Kribbella shirazensis TaxID=1105143 RepID=A0A7X5VAU9_9ACTN|nr:histidine kinase [Kribbella shirazensis]NIK57406.1 signal transduction histidine kinase [Kribbella shirazensis]